MFACLEKRIVGVKFWLEEQKSISLKLHTQQTDDIEILEQTCKDSEVINHFTQGLLKTK